MPQKQLKLPEGRSYCSSVCFSTWFCGAYMACGCCQVNKEWAYMVETLCSMWAASHIPRLGRGNALRIAHANIVCSHSVTRWWGD